MRKNIKMNRNGKHKTHGTKIDKRIEGGSWKLEQ